MRGTITPLPQYAFMVWCSVKQRDNFTFYLLPTNFVGTIQWYSELFRRVKRPGREADHLSPSNAKVKNAWNYTFTPPVHLGAVSK
jgi:hypothetical protein